MPKLFILTASLLVWIPDILCMVTSSRELTLLEGQSVTVACPYEPEYAGYVKYWCQGRMREFCSSLARTDGNCPANADKAIIWDDPVQQVFSVTMNNLKVENTGWYMCGLEVGSGWTADVGTFTYIKVIHGMSVASNQVIGEEGSSLSIQCLYSDGLRDSEKKWCRMGNMSSCLQTDAEGGYEDTWVGLRDDRNRTFTVTLKELQPTDAAWFWCLAGSEKIPVQVLVTPRRAPKTTPFAANPPTSVPSDVHLPPPKPILSRSSQWPMDQALMVCSCLLVLVVIATLGRLLWRKSQLQHPAPLQDLVMRQGLQEKMMIKMPLDGVDPEKANVY